jgi:AcrR family transcriptional regulator
VRSPRGHCESRHPPFCGERFPRRHHAWIGSRAGRVGPRALPALQKQARYRAIIEIKSQPGDQHVDGLALLLEGGDDRAIFRYLGNLILEGYEDDPDFMRLLLFSALEGHELADLFFERQVQGYFRLVSSHIQRRIEEGKFRPVDAQAAAYGFNGMVSHYGLTRLLFSNRVAQKSRAEMVDEMVEIFLGGVALADDVAPDSRPAR